MSPANLNLSPEEKRVFGQLFRQADTENIGVVTGEVAVKFFEKTRLDPHVLGEVSLLEHGYWNSDDIPRLKGLLADMAMMLDMANCRYGEQRSTYASWLRKGFEVDRALSSW